jgi:hypothetical protein
MTDGVNISHTAAGEGAAGVKSAPLHILTGVQIITEIS